MSRTRKNRMIANFFVKWFNYIFKRNPFLNRKEEERYARRMLALKGFVNYENWLLKIVPLPAKRNFIYVEMKNRGGGYIFEAVRS